MQEDIQIDILIARFFSGEATPEEAMQLEDWANLSPENRSYLNTSANILTMNLTLNTIENKQQVWENIQNFIDKPVAPDRKRINWWWINVAASVFTLLAISLLIYTLTNLKYETIIYEAKAVSKIIRLNDNSEIVLSPNSSFTIDKDYGTVSRVVKLKGSAQFSVIHDATRPFSIYIDKLHILDLGTVFNIKTSPEGNFILIDVTEGEIAVYDDSGLPKMLKAGQKATYNKSQKHLHLIHLTPAESHKSGSINGGKTTVSAPDTTRKKKANAKASAADTSIKVYSNSTYPSPYPPDKRYAREEIEKLLFENTENAKKIIADMRKDGLVDKDVKDEQVSFKISNEGFIINGKVQSEKVYLRYKKKYFPYETTSRNWSWRHNFDESGTKN